MLPVPSTHTTYRGPPSPPWDLEPSTEVPTADCRPSPIAQTTLPPGALGRRAEKLLVCDDLTEEKVFKDDWEASKDGAAASSLGRFGLSLLALKNSNLINFLGAFGYKFQTSFFFCLSSQYQTALSGTFPPIKVLGAHKSHLFSVIFLIKQTGWALSFSARSWLQGCNCEQNSTWAVISCIKNTCK